MAWCDNLPNNIKIQLDQETEERDVADLFSRTIGVLQLSSISVVGDNLTRILELLGNEVKYNVRYKEGINDINIFIKRFANLYKGFISQPSNAFSFHLKGGLDYQAATPDT
jgi:hypothetical protein